MTGRRNVVAELLGTRVSEDPVTAALRAPLEAAVVGALDRHLPRLAFTSAEVASMLGCSTSTVNDLVQQGRLVRVAGPQSTISLGSLLDLVGWPMQEAPVAAPLAVVPDVLEPNEGGEELSS